MGVAHLALIFKLAMKLIKLVREVGLQHACSINSLGLNFTTAQQACLQVLVVLQLPRH